MLTRISLILACLASSASAEQSCNSHGLAVKQLAERWGETFQSYGLSSLGQRIEVWTNPRTHTFTVLEIDTNGHTCIVVNGEGWQTKPLGDPA